MYFKRGRYLTTMLLRNGFEWNWTLDYDKVFNKIKQILIAKPLLALHGLKVYPIKKLLVVCIQII